MRDGDGGSGEGVLGDCLVEDGEGLAEDFVLRFEECDEWRGGVQSGSLGKNQKPVRVIAEWGRGVKARESSKNLNHRGHWGHRESAPSLLPTSVEWVG
jgi:hypothetical protein